MFNWMTMIMTICLWFAVFTNNWGLYTWLIMLWLCGVIVFIFETRRCCSRAVAEHDQYITSVKIELLNSYYRKRFKRILGDLGLVKDGNEGVVAIVLAEAYTSDMLKH